MNRLMAVVTVTAAISVAAHAQTGAQDGEWRYYGADPGHTKYSPLDQINADNVAELEIAWEWEAGDLELAQTARQRPGAFKNSPIYVNGTLYVSTPFSRVAALDPASGSPKWEFNPEAYKLGRPAGAGWQHRGVSYWTDGSDERILICTSRLQLIALNAKTGETYENFGQNGVVDVLATLIDDENERRMFGNSAPVAIVGNTAIVGSTMHDRPTSPYLPAGHVQGFDVRSGELKWTFHTVPQNDEFGVDTWEEGSWKYSGNTNVWSMMSVDPELGYVYLPVSTPTNDYYGGHRKGDNLFAESIVCLDGETGERVWHFQAVHHGLWDYDFPCAPTLCDIVVDGKPIKAVAAASKQGWVYVFDRVTGEPVWPIEERPVPQTTVPGEQTSPTQPFVTKPPAFVQQGFTEEDVIDFTPELKAEVLEILKDYTLGPLFTPPTVLGADGKKGVLQMPSAAGGANWGGTAFDPETGLLYLEAANQPSLAHVSPGDKNRGVQADYLILGPMAAAGPQGLPLWKPPYAVVVAIDLNEGDIAWRVPHGQGPTDHPAIKHLKLGPLGDTGHGFLSSSGPCLTKTLLFLNHAPVSPTDFISPALDRLYLRAFDKTNGEVLWEHRMEHPPYGTPMTYMHNGKQYVVVATGGSTFPCRLVAFALPDDAASGS